MSGQCKMRTTTVLVIVDSSTVAVWLYEYVGVWNQSKSVLEQVQ